MNISAITQDKLGYIWVATMGGVSRYNGYEFKRFYFDSENPESLSSNHVSSIYCASDGTVFIGTAIGLNYYDAKKEKIVKPFADQRFNVFKIAEHKEFIYLATERGLFRFGLENKILEELGRNQAEKPIANALFFDEKGQLWCGLDNGKGLAVYDIKTDRFDIYQNTTQSQFMNSNSIRSICKVSDRCVLLGTKGGVSCFDLENRKFIDNSDFTLLTSSLADFDIRFILEKEPSVFWIGTLQSGFFIYDKSRNIISNLKTDDGFSEIHSNNYMNCFRDKSGNIWFGTFDAGLDVWFAQTRNFNFDVVLNSFTRNKFITFIESDNDKNLIIGTREKGFWIYNPESKTYKLYTKDNCGLKHNNLRDIFVDSENKYWLGIYFGLQIFNPSDKSFKTIKIAEPNNGAVSFLQIGNRVFTGTDGQGLLIFDLKGNLQKQVKENGINIPMIIQLNENEVLFGSYGIGLFVMNINTYAIREIDLADVGKYPGLLFAMTAYKDKNGIVWVGTYNYGMFLFDFNKASVRNINIGEGLPSTDAIGFMEDENSNMWVSTSLGLVRLNMNDFSIKTYSTNEGVNNYQFHGKAVHKDHKGIIYFGGNLGITYFNPSEIIIEPNEAANVVLENLYIKNLQVFPSESNKVLNKSIQYTNQITLTHRDQIFSIDFVSFDYLSPEKVSYFYMLEGFDKDWYNVGNQRRVSYSNLSRGNYVFKVKAINYAGVHSENEAVLKIKIKPAPWFSTVAWILYFLIFASLAWFIFRLRIKTFLYKKDLEIEHSEHMREREINLMKQKFFTNISHELRTPLTLIYGLVSQLSSLEKLNPKVKEFAQSLDLNVTRLLKLVNQLLAFKKMEGETLSLWLEIGNLNQAIQRILVLFEVYSKEKNIRIEFQEFNISQLWFDFDKLEKILSNLLSNAIKHSYNGSRIVVLVAKINQKQVNQYYKNFLNPGSKEFMEISVIDQGHGIDEKDWDSIFDRYKQVETEGKKLPDYSGTGIGLNFTKSLVELHKGSIRMTSQTGFGTTFAFILPCDKSVYQQNDFSVSNQTIENVELETEPIKNVPHNSEILTDRNKLILIVEDDLQLNRFLINILKPFYKIIVAHDGEKGLKMVKQELPDLVISDIMMPKKDGYELTRELKENREFCHIPVILLTAKSDNLSQVEGMESGADFYISKPFNVDFLLSVVSGQLKNRKRIQDIFLNGRMPILDKTDINQLDIQFLSKLNQLLVKELSNPDLDIQLLARNMNLSRSVFYRKFMSLTKLSPIAYIKKYRIEKSIELMYSGKYSLTEISEMTGFSSPSYFSTAFKQEKGIGPREFLNQSKEEATSGQ